jgi:hypothetical protein
MLSRTFHKCFALRTFPNLFHSTFITFTFLEFLLTGFYYHGSCELLNVLNKARSFSGAMQPHTAHIGHKSCRRSFTLRTSTPSAVLFGLLKATHGRRPIAQERRSGNGYSWRMANGIAWLFTAKECLNLFMPGWEKCHSVLRVCVEKKFTINQCK